MWYALEASVNSHRAELMNDANEARLARTARRARREAKRRERKQCRDEATTITDAIPAQPEVAVTPIPSI